MDDAQLEQEVKRLRARRRDDARTEAKACSQGLSHDVWESVSAFANTRGGIILLGLDERARFTPTKGFEADRVLNAFVEGMGDGAAHGIKLTNPPRYTIERLTLEGKQVLCATIQELDMVLKPSFITAKGIVGGSYKRIDDKDIRLSPTEIYELQYLTLSAQSDRTAVPGADIDDLMQGVLDGYLSVMRRSGSKALRGIEAREDQLRSLGVVSRDGSVRLASLLCFGRYPQGFYPKLTIDVAVFPALRKSEPGLPRFVDRTVCEGYLAEVVDDALAAIARNLRTTSYVEGLARRDEPEMPMTVLREALANAVLHREYAPQFLGQSVSVEIYPDRLEISNPGGLWGGKTVENIADGSSRCRNDLLMSFVSNLPDTDGLGAFSEGQGSGIAMMERELERRGLPLPEYEVGLDSFKVVLRRRTPGSINPVAAQPPTEARDPILELFGDSQDVELGARDISEAIGLGLPAVRARLKRLVDAGSLVATAPPTSKARRYRLA